jgi:hypothetical protein
LERHYCQIDRQFGYFFRACALAALHGNTRKPIRRALSHPFQELVEPIATLGGRFLALREEIARRETIDMFELDGPDLEPRRTCRANNAGNENAPGKSFFGKPFLKVRNQSVCIFASDSRRVTAQVGLNEMEQLSLDVRGVASVLAGVGDPH